MKQHQIKELSSSSFANIDLDKRMQKKKMKIFAIYNVNEMGIRITVMLTYHDLHIDNI